MKKVLLLLFVLPMLSAFSDHFSIFVYLEGAKEVPLVYHCSELYSGYGSSEGERVVQFSCGNGMCTNEEWFTGQNPCLGASSGYFTYEFKGRSYTTGQVSITGETNYEYNLELDIGSIIIFVAIANVAAFLILSYFVPGQSLGTSTWLIKLIIAALIESVIF